MSQTVGRVSVLSAVGLALALVSLSAQAPQLNRVVLQKGDLSAPGREVVMARAEFTGAGATTGRHTHPGEEVSYVLEGEVKLEVEGEPTRVLHAGDVFLVPAGKVHNATAGSAGKVLANYIVEKGKPLTTPAP